MGPPDTPLTGQSGSPPPGAAAESGSAPDPITAANDAEPPAAPALGDAEAAATQSLAPALAGLRTVSEPAPASASSAILTPRQAPTASAKDGPPGTAAPFSSPSSSMMGAAAPAGSPGRSPLPGGKAGGMRQGGRPGLGGGLGSSKMPPGLAAKMAAMTNRNAHSSPSLRPDQRLDPSVFLPLGPADGSPASSGPIAGPSRGSLGLTGRTASGPAIVSGGPGGLRARKGPGLTLGTMAAGAGPGGPAITGRVGANGVVSGGTGSRMKPQMKLNAGPPAATPFANFSKIVDPNGRLNFGGKAVLHAKGVDFSNGSSFAIDMSQLTLMEEVGKGNYGTVQKVYHKPTKVIMAMKEIRLELDHSKLKAILTELDILHRAISDTIVEFYGAFFIESCVYYCMEYMDAGSLDKLAGADVPERVLARVTRRVVEGLRFLKDELQIIHRDVKPTNILVNGKGETKLCDFGVSGQLERSMAKTNIGCQSYMAPERIQGEHQGQTSTYTVSSDVWSLGLSIIEFAAGHYPYEPETYSNIFAQLTAIVHGPVPRLPDQYSEIAQDFVASCLRKPAEQRPTYAQLLDHPFLRENADQEVNMQDWVKKAMEEAKAKKTAGGSVSSSESNTPTTVTPTTG